MYKPALITLLNASSSVGFSKNFVIYPSSRWLSISPPWELDNPTIPNCVGSSTSHKAIVTLALDNLWAFSKTSKSEDKTESPEATINVFTSISSSNFTLPAVPIGVFS